MPNPIWNDLDHRLSVIPRWVTAERVHQQSVATHIFNVERMAIRIAKEWFGITDKEELFEIVQWAHHHEDLEVLSGDLPTMIKPYFDEKAMARDHNDIVKAREPHNGLAYCIVKLADMFDAWWFLCVERSLGNRYLDNHVNFEPTRILKYVSFNWPGSPELLDKAKTLIDDMANERSVRHSKRGR